MNDMKRERDKQTGSLQLADGVFNQRRNKKGGTGCFDWFVFLASSSLRLGTLTVHGIDRFLLPLHDTEALLEWMRRAAVVGDVVRQWRGE